MALEIERKFLVDTSRLALLPGGERIRQGYIATEARCAVRVRISGGRAWLTLKGGNRGAVRSEFEYAIPVADAEAILDELCSGPVIEKTRYLIEYAGHCWEVDVFEGDNAGLVVAEVELSSEHEQVTLPDWVTEEVTDDPRYYNANLLKHPYRQWR